ncbi:MAG: hypothetical protein ATN31_01785 [Candidatus Epulonipiscioides saccharophilum]|nr:MAG: hypothetical protein ATN31_01785 [Epulopiscium sp. AS2M-Bin001]
MIIEQNFLKNIPIGYDVISKLLNFEKQLLEMEYKLKEMPRGYGICKVSNTNIFKFRLNSRDRILFTFVKNRTTMKDDIIFLKFVSHDNQIRESHGYYDRKSKMNQLQYMQVDMDQIAANKYPEDEIDEYINKTYTNYFDMSIIKGVVIKDEDLVRIANQDELKFIQYLSDEQYKVVTSKNNQILLTGAGGTGKTIVLLHILSLADINTNSLYLTYTDLLLEKANKDYEVFITQNNNLEFLTIRKLLSKLANIPDNKIITTPEIRRWLQQESYKYSIIKNKELHELVTELRGVLTGYLGLEYKFVSSKVNDNQRLLALDAYLSMPAQYSVFNAEEKREMYTVALAYQKWLERIDKYSENEVARKILSEQTLDKYDYIVIDEIQDLSELHIYLISQLVKPSGKIVWAGDMNQAIYPTFFNFGRLKNLYYTYDKQLENKVLTKNFRTTKQITNFMNLLVKNRQKYIGSSSYDYHEVALQEGVTPKVLNFLPHQFKKLFLELMDKHYCAVIVDTERSKNNLINLYPGIARRVFLIHEIKGLEYDNIYCYDIMSDYTNKWIQILNGDYKKNEQMKYYFNLLYVGVSRAKSNLFIYESDYDKLDFEPLRNCEIITEYNIELAALTQQSTAKDWTEEARRLEQSGHIEHSKLAQEKADHLEQKDPNEPVNVTKEYPAEIVQPNKTSTNKAEEITKLKLMAENDDIQAQYQLGLCYKKGLGVIKNAETAFVWLEKAAQKDHAEAQCELAAAYAKGDFTQKNLKWYYGDGAKQDLENSIFWYKKSAYQGVSEAQYQLARCYKKGLGVEKNILEAIFWYEKAADQEHTKALCSLGNCYAIGDGVRKNLLTAVEFWEKAANHNNVNAQYVLGECYDQGWYGVEKDFEKAVGFWEKAAEQRFAPALFRMAQCYDQGRGVEQNLKKALKLYEKSATDGYVTAQYTLSLIYQKQKNYKKAFKWLEKAATSNHIESIYQLAILYDEGKGVKKDTKKAFDLYKKAADNNHTAAQFIIEFRK